MLNIDVKTNEAIEEPDIRFWHEVRSESVNVLYVYHVDEPEETKRELVAEYPNGGKDYRETVIRPEAGHFSVTMEDGERFPYHVNIPDGIPKDNPVPDVIDLRYWERYTPQEIAERDEEEARLKAEGEARETMLEELPNTLASTDDAICMLYEMVLEGQNG